MKHEVEETGLRAIFASSPDAITVSDLNGNITDCNQATLELHGFSSKEELIGKNGRKLVGKKDRKRVMENLKKTLEQGSIKNVEYTFLTKDGREFPAELSASVIKDSSGNLIGFVAITKAITKRKKMEEELRESEEKYRTLYEAIKDGMAGGPMDGRIAECNQAFADLLGYSKDELRNLTYQQLTPKRWHQMEAKIVEEQILRRGYSDEYEKEYIRKDGTVFPISAKVWLVRDEDGKPKGMWGIVRDITERKKAEEKIRESEERLRQLIEYAPDAIYINDLKGNFIDGNKQAENLIGYKKEEIIGKSFLKIGLLPKRYVPKATKALMKNLLGQKTGPDEFELIRKDGTRVDVEISTFPVKREGKVEVIGIARDVTERKQMEEKLRQYSEHLEELVQKRTEELSESEKRYSVLVEEARDGVGILQDGKLVFVNKIASEIYGYSRDELIGLFFVELVDEKYRQLVIERYRRRMRGEKVPSTYEIEIVAKNGERVPVELSATHINYQGRPADLVIARDIRERKRMEEERLKLEKLATIGELATMVGHDLRNPLQSIENAAYYLNNELSRFPPSIPISQKTMEMLQVINNSVNSADKIIKDLQDFSATKKPMLKKTNVNAIVKETLSQVETPKNVELITELGHLPHIEADKDQIKRIFLNLATNGIQAIENGGRLKVSTKKTKDFVEVSFKDTGVGMPKENMEKLFTPFFTTRAKGIGMGLAICKKFVDNHGGSIKVESKEGKGSTFTVKLPIQ